MRRSAFAVALVCLGLVCAAGVAKARPASAEDEVVAAEQARADALVHQDYKALDKILAGDLIFIHASGRADTKAAFMGNLTSGHDTYTRVDKVDAKVRVMGDFAIMSGEFMVQTAGAPGTPQRDPEDLIGTGVWQKRDGRWQLISWQSTRKSGPAAGGPPPAAK
jgi:ketosteroid isomerase-like protein